MRAVGSPSGAFSVGTPVAKGNVRGNFGRSKDRAPKIHPLGKVDRMKTVHDVVRVTQDANGAKLPEPIVVGEVSCVQYETWDEVPVEARADILKDSNRQRLQDVKNIARADYWNGGQAVLKREQKEILAKLGAGNATPDDIARLAEIARKLTK